MRVSILNAGGQTDYLYGVVTGLAAQPDLRIDVIDGDASQNIFSHLPQVHLFNLRGDNRSPMPLLRKAFVILRYYLRLIRYTLTTDSRLFHIQWDNSMLLFDRSLLLLFYKLCGKKLVYTAHNVSQYARDGRETLYHRCSLRCLYRLVDAIIVHTDRMKSEIVSEYGIPEQKLFVVRHGLNIFVPKSGMSKSDARQSLGISGDARVALFFGYIHAYKGTDLLLDAAAQAGNRGEQMTLLLAGKYKCPPAYRVHIEQQLSSMPAAVTVKSMLEFIPRERVETLFAAADCVVMPYRHIFQSGVIFLAYRFGLPILAADVGSFREDILEGQTGMLCPPNDAAAFANLLSKFFTSDLFTNQEETRHRIAGWAEERYSWNSIGRETAGIYARIMEQH